MRGFGLIGPTFESMGGNLKNSQGPLQINLDDALTLRGTSVLIVHISRLIIVCRNLDYPQNQSKRTW